MTAKITKIKIDGLRTLSNFELELGKLAVLIGENGSGKSSVVEAFEILRRVTNRSFIGEYNTIHGGDFLLRRHSAKALTLSIGFEHEADKGEYELSCSSSGFSHERLLLRGFLGEQSRSREVRRTGEDVTFSDDNPAEEAIRKHLKSNNLVVKNKHKLSATKSIFDMEIDAESPEFDPWSKSLVRQAWSILSAIEVHVPFSCGAQWAAQSIGDRSKLREPVLLLPAEKLDRFGLNLPNAYHTLKNEHSHQDWEYTMELVRAGLGEWVESVNTPAGAGGGSIALSLKRFNVDSPIPAAALSDGQLAYLAFVALARLPTERSILVFDEVDLHLHPRMLTNVLLLLEQISKKCPVLITTHSRRLLDALDDPVGAVRILELEPNELKTVVSRLDRVQLKLWMERYDGLGDVLDAGYPEALLTERSKD